jgi:hypothetical protein
MVDTVFAPIVFALGSGEGTIRMVGADTLDAEKSPVVWSQDVLRDVKVNSFGCTAFTLMFVPFI